MIIKACHQLSNENFMENYTLLHENFVVSRSS